MLRTEMINIVGKEFLTSNIENDEFSYPKEFKRLGMNFIPVKSLRDNRKFEKIDIRFVKGNVSVLIETKVDFERDKTAEEQLSAYIKYEKQLTGNRIVAILANTSNDNIKVYRGIVSDNTLMPKETVLKDIDEYVGFYTAKINNKEEVMKNTYELNKLLHKHGIKESLRSQFVGTCLLALKNNELFYQIPISIDVSGKSKEEIDKEYKEISKTVNS